MYLEIPLDYGNQTEMISVLWDQRQPRTFSRIFLNRYSLSYVLIVCPEWKLRTQRQHVSHFLTRRTVFNRIIESWTPSQPGWVLMEVMSLGSRKRWQVWHNVGLGQSAEFQRPSQSVSWVRWRTRSSWEIRKKQATNGKAGWGWQAGLQHTTNPGFGEV